MNQDPLFYTLIASFVSALTVAVVTSVLTAWQRRGEKRLDWSREDEVSRKAKQVANDLRESNKLTNGKLDQIHTLVNSNMTASMKAELEATIEKLKLMRQIVARDKADNIKVLPEALTAIRNVEVKISELTATLNDRLKQTELAEAQLKKNPS